jgi:hypothetical protein
MIIESTSIFEYDKRKNKKPFECDVFSHSFHMNVNLLKDDMGLDELEFLFRLAQQDENTKNKFHYRFDNIGKLYGNSLEEVGKQLSKITHLEYSIERLGEMWGYPYSR